MNSSAKGMLGILNRAGLVAFGYDCLAKMKKASLVLLASDASDNTVSKIASAAKSAGVRVIQIESKAELGQPLGYPELSAVAILSQKGAKSFREKLQKGE